MRSRRASDRRRALEMLRHRVTTESHLFDDKEVLLFLDIAANDLRNLLHPHTHTHAHTHTHTHGTVKKSGGTQWSREDALDSQMALLCLHVLSGAFAQEHPHVFERLLPRVLDVIGDTLLRDAKQHITHKNNQKKKQKKRKRPQIEHDDTAYDFIHQNLYRLQLCAASAVCAASFSQALQVRTYVHTYIHTYI